MRWPTVVLDRDGVINRDSTAYIKSPAEWTPLPGSLSAIARLNRAGCRVVVATNQSGLGRGLFGPADLQATHDRMTRELAACGGRLDGIFFCPHTPAADCDCRKPRPGLLNDIKARWQLASSDCVMIGDSPTDAAAAHAAGMAAIGVCSGKPVDTSDPRWAGVTFFADLTAVVDHLLGPE